MALAKLADKTTLDKIDTDVTALKSRGGFKVSGDDLYGFDVANSEWVKIKARQLSGANPTLIVINKDMTMTGKPVTVSNAFYSRTQVMPNAKFDVFALPTLGNYTVSWTSAGKPKSEVITIDALGGKVAELVNYPSFSQATWTEISNLLNLAYTTDFDLTDIWDVGNKKTVDFNGTERDIVILDFDYDTLTTAIGENTKAKITCAVNGSVTNRQVQYNLSEDTNWNTKDLKDYVNNTFYNTMPSGLKAIVKPINKSGASVNCSILSTGEYNGSNNYLYLKDSENIAFLNGSWLREGYKAYYLQWYFITSGYGTNHDIPWTTSKDVVPIFSI